MIEERNTFIVRCGEVALKGLNKPYFERMLVDRIKRALKKYDGVEVKRNEGFDINGAEGFSAKIQGEKNQRIVVLAQSGMDDYVAKVTDAYIK